jgi:hypothetical protein
MNIRVKLKTDYNGYKGYPYKRGQTRTAIGTIDDFIAVLWDGFHQDKKVAEQVPEGKKGKPFR